MSRERERSILNISGTNIIKITREWNSRKIDIEAVWETTTENWKGQFRSWRRTVKIWANGETAGGLHRKKRKRNWKRVGGLGGWMSLHGVSELIESRLFP